jgi:hypothetical protein
MPATVSGRSCLPSLGSNQPRPAQEPGPAWPRNHRAKP